MDSDVCQDGLSDASQDDKCSWESLVPSSPHPFTPSFLPWSVFPSVWEPTEPAHPDTEPAEATCLVGCWGCISKQALLLLSPSHPQGPGHQPPAHPHQPQLDLIRWAWGGEQAGPGQAERQGHTGSWQPLEGQRRHLADPVANTSAPREIPKGVAFKAHIPALLLDSRYEVSTRLLLTQAGGSQVWAGGRQVGGLSPEPHTDTFTERCAESHRGSGAFQPATLQEPPVLGPRPWAQAGRSPCRLGCCSLKGSGSSREGHVACAIKYPPTLSTWTGDTGSGGCGTKRGSPHPAAVKSRANGLWPWNVQVAAPAVTAGLCASASCLLPQGFYVTAWTPGMVPVLWLARHVPPRLGSRRGQGSLALRAGSTNE